MKLWSGLRRFKIRLMPIDLSLFIVANARFYPSGKYECLSQFSIQNSFFRKVIVTDYLDRQDKQLNVTLLANAGGQ